MSEVSELLRARTNVANKDVKDATSAKSFYAVGCAHLQSSRHAPVSFGLKLIGSLGLNAFIVT